MAKRGDTWVLLIAAAICSFVIGASDAATYVKTDGTTAPLAFDPLERPPSLYPPYDGPDWAPGVDLTGRGELSGAGSVVGAVAPDADLRGALLYGSDFLYGDFRGADFRGATLTLAPAVNSWVAFNQSDLRGANFEGAVISGFLELINADNANFRNATFFNPGFDGWAFSTARFADFSNTTFTNFSFADVDLRGANFRNANFGNSQLTVILSWDNADFSGADLSSVDLSTADAGPPPGSPLYDQFTQFPAGYDPIAKGWTLVPEPSASFLLASVLIGLPRMRPSLKTRR